MNGKQVCKNYRPRNIWTEHILPLDKEVGIKRQKRQKIEIDSKKELQTHPANLTWLDIYYSDDHEF